MTFAYVVSKEKMDIEWEFIKDNEESLFSAHLVPFPLTDKNASQKTTVYTREKAIEIAKRDVLPNDTAQFIIYQVKLPRNEHDIPDTLQGLSVPDSHITLDAALTPHIPAHDNFVAYPKLASVTRTDSKTEKKKKVLEVAASIQSQLGDNPPMQPPADLKTMATGDAENLAGSLTLTINLPDEPKEELKTMGTSGGSSLVEELEGFVFEPNEENVGKKEEKEEETEGEKNEKNAHDLDSSADNSKKKQKPAPRFNVVGPILLSALFGVGFYCLYGPLITMAVLSKAGILLAPSTMNTVLLSAFAGAMGSGMVIGLRRLAKHVFQSLANQLDQKLGISTISKQPEDNNPLISPKLKGIMAELSAQYGLNQEKLADQNDDLAKTHKVDHMPTREAYFSDMLLSYKAVQLEQDQAKKESELTAVKIKYGH